MFEKIKESGKMKIGDLFDWMEFREIKTIKLMIFICSSILIICIGTLLMIIYFPSFDSETAWKVYNSPEGFDCSNLTFFETAQCLNDYVNLIFVYNVTDDDIELSMEELISRGGDCRNWNTDFYYQNLKSLGFDARTERFFIKTIKNESETIDIYHTVTFGFSEEGYCLLDMKDINCFVYEVEDGSID